MAKIGNNIIVYLLILSWVSLISCFYFSKLHHKQKLIHSIQQYQNQLPLLKLILTDSLNSKLRWIDEHEFFLNGKMYDIVSKEKNQDQEQVIYCIEDGEELELINAFHTIIATEKDNNNSNICQAISSIYLDQFFQLNIIQIQKKYSDHKNIKLIYYSQVLWNDITICTLTPPPNLG